MLKIYPGANLTIKNRINTTTDIIHEIGHALAKGEDGFYNKFIDKVGKNYFEEKSPFELSIYAKMNEREFFAEAFADYVTNKEKASKAGKLIPEFLKEQGII